MGTSMLWITHKDNRPAAPATTRYNVALQQALWDELRITASNTSNIGCSIRCQPEQVLAVKELLGRFDPGCTIRAT